MKNSFTKFPLLIPSSRFAKLLAGLFAGLLLACPLLALDAVVESKTKGAGKHRDLHFPPPSSPAGSPQLVVKVLLGPGEVLPADGKFSVWVGLSSGAPLANAEVKVVVFGGLNQFVAEGQRSGSVTLRTNSRGLAEVQMAGPVLSPGNSIDPLLIRF